MKELSSRSNLLPDVTLKWGQSLLGFVLLAASGANAAVLDTLRPKANQPPPKDSAPPVISITTPSDNVSLTTWRVDVRGYFKSAALKQITVNTAPAFVSSNTFEALNVLLQPGTNTIRVKGEDFAGNAITNIVRVICATDANAFTNDPVRLIPDPLGGFAPLAVSFRVNARVPGEIKQVYFDFNGDHVTDKAVRNLQLVTYTYAEPGERFPTVTVETTVGRFSSMGSAFAFFPARPVNVQAPPVLLRTIEVTDPIDLKSTKEGLYVLSGSAASITEFDPAGKVVRSLKGISGTPTGLEVDQMGNVYVAMNGSNQVWKFKPSPSSFESDRSFGNGGFIGNEDGSAGSSSNQFNAPFDVAVSPDGEHIFVADSGNSRIQRFSSAGRFRSLSDGGVKRLRSPKGVICDDIGQLFIADTGNDRVVVFLAESYSIIPRGVSGETGASLGQFRGPVNLCIGIRGICVADFGNDRVQFFDPGQGGHTELTPFSPRFAISTELGLKQPNAVAWASDLLEEKVYIADTGNNRVVLVKMPTEDPELAWNAMKQHLLVGDISGALAYFSSSSVDMYREAYASFGTKDLIEMFSRIPPIKPVLIEGDKAQYRFEQLVEGHLITFPIDFVKENGKWKIDAY